MSRSYTIKAEVAFGGINFNPKLDKAGYLLNESNIPGVDITTKLLDFFSLKLSNKSDKVLVKGQFVISTGDDRICSEDTKLSVGIEIYRDFERSVLAYKNSSVLAGVVQNSGPKIQWAIPVQFDDSPPLPATADVATYYVNIVVNQSTTSINHNLELVQYSLIGMER